jgi:anti-sigma factor RsiW
MTEILEAITCRELVELVTDYLEGALPEADRIRFEQHLASCEGCTIYLEQMQLVVKASGRLREEELDPQARDVLLETFQGWKRSRGSPA